MTADQRFFGGLFAGERAVHPRGVKIGEAPFDKGVHHLFHLFHIDFGRVVRVEGRQPHQAEAQFFVVHKYLRHYDRICIFSYYTT